MSPTCAKKGNQLPIITPKVGFKIIPNWNSCFKHEKLKLFLLVYVDDFKLAGPAKNLEHGWKLIQSVITIDKPFFESPPASHEFGITWVISHN